MFGCGSRASYLQISRVFNSGSVCLPVQRCYYATQPKRNHYEVLGLHSNCTHSQIRQAFVKLSKKFHPDTNPKDTKLHDKFVEINNAYSVLIKPDKRREYDMILRNPSMDPTNIRARQAAAAQAAGGYYRNYGGDPTYGFYQNRDRSKDAYYEEKMRKNYYGIPGVPKLSNRMVAILFVMLWSIMYLLQYMHYRILGLRRIENLNRMDREAKEHLSEVQARAKRLSQDELLDRIAPTNEPRGD